MTITAIVPAARKPGRFDILVDGSAAATVSIEAIDRLRLSVGAEVDERLLEAIRREGAVLATFDRALDMLALRARSSAELRRQLLRKGEPPESVEVALPRLEEAGYLNDGSFARQFTRSKALGAGMSRRRLRQELGRRGIESGTSDQAIKEVFEEEQIDEEQNLERVARKKLRSLAKLDPALQRRRLFAFLARRGYDMEDVSRVVRKLLGEQASD